MFQTILVGYDGPERGGEAIALAETLGDRWTGTLLLTSVNAVDEFDALDDETNEVLADARDGLRRPDRAQIRAFPSDSPAGALTQIAAAEHADLVVVGSSHRSALGRPLPGMTAERLVHDAPCPVAVASRGYSGGDVRRIGVAYDGSAEADAALHAAESLALELRASLTLYCVAGQTPRLNREAVVLSGVPAEEIAGRAYGVVDLLFVGSRGSGPLGRALLGNVSGALVREAGCPVVVVPRVAVAPRPESMAHVPERLVR